MGQIALVVLAVALMSWVCLGSTGEISQAFSFGAEVTGNPSAVAAQARTHPPCWSRAGAVLGLWGWGVRSERSCCHRS